MNEVLEEGKPWQSPKVGKKTINFEIQRELGNHIEPEFIGVPPREYSFARSGAIILFSFVITVISIYQRD